MAMTDLSTSAENAKNSSWQGDLALLFVAILAFFCIGLGARAYLTPSEARYIEIPRQILSLGDWLTPHINGVQYFEKPPLFYWLQAVFLNIGDMVGGGEFWGRIATALVVTLTCLTTYATGRLLYGRSCGWLAACALATSVLGYGLSRVAMLDAPVTLFLTLSIASFLFAQKTGNAKYYYVMYAAAALAVMTKGLIGIVIPAIIIGSWIIISNNWKTLKSARLFTGTLLFLAIAAPWHVLMAMKHPEFLDFYFIHEHVTRFLTNEHKRTAPWWFFIAVTAVGVMPWLAALGFRGQRSEVRKEKNDKMFLWLWILLPIIFFSSSHSKLVPYIFPIFPPLFILIGKILAEWWNMPTAPKLLRANAIFMVILTAGGLVGYQLFAPHPKLPSLPFNGLMPLTLVLSALLTASLLKKTPAKTLIAWLGIFGATLGLTANYTVAKLDTSTVRPLALMLKDKLNNGDMVVAYNSYWQDLPIYLQQDITVVDWKGELGFGAQHTANAENWMIDSETFWTRCSALRNTKNNIYLFIREGELVKIPVHNDCKLHEISRYGKTVLLTTAK